MSAPIKREDIRKGDVIRQTFQYTAEVDGQHQPGLSKFELIERPVALPTEPGFYADKDDYPWCITEGDVLDPKWAPYTLLRPVAEVAAETFERAALFLENDGRSVAARQMRSYALSEANE